MTEPTPDQIKKEFDFLKPELNNRNKYDDFAEDLRNAIIQSRKVFTQEDARLDREKQRLRIASLEKILEKITDKDVEDMIAASWFPEPDYQYEESTDGSEHKDEGPTYDPNILIRLKELTANFLVQNRHDEGIRVTGGVIKGFKNPEKSNNEGMLYWLLEDVWVRYVKLKITKGRGASTSYFRSAVNLIAPGRFNSDDAARDWVREFLRQEEGRPKGKPQALPMNHGQDV